MLIPPLNISTLADIGIENNEFDSIVVSCISHHIEQISWSPSDRRGSGSGSGQGHRFTCAALRWALTSIGQHTAIPHVHHLRVFAPCRRPSRTAWRSPCRLAPCTVNSCAPFVWICWRTQWQPKNVCTASAPIVSSQLWDLGEFFHTVVKRERLEIPVFRSGCVPGASTGGRALK